MIRVSYFIGHAPQGFWPVLNQGTPAVLFSFVSLYISGAGPGPWSLDALRRPHETYAQEDVAIPAAADRRLYKKAG